MLEVYVVLTLSAIGYLLNSMNNSVKPKRNEINKFEMPSMSTIYNSDYAKKAEETERKIAEKAYKEALKPKKSQRIMSLAGELIDEDNFKHNNMEPYFGGRIKQNMTDDRNRVLLENFTGVSDTPKNKCEVKSFYDHKKDLGNVFGMANYDAFLKERMEPPKIRNNEMPVEQIRVGPGLNKGYTEKPTGGYQQFDVGEIARQGQKCVDELRVKSKPKTTFAARTVDGLKTGLRGDSAPVDKNRAERYFEQTPDMYFTTTGAVLKPSTVPQFNVKATHRLTTSRDYTGTARGANKRRADGSVRLSSKPQFKEAGVRNAVLSFFGLGTSDDYGKKDIVVYNNERDLTTTRTYQGNLTSLIKAIVAPLEDVMKVSKKEEFTANPRQYGNMSAAMPDKETLYPEDAPRTTTRETLHDEAHLGNLKGAEKITIWDATDAARTTIKETNLHDEIGTGTVTGPKEIYVYDPDEIAKTTGRETLDDVDFHANVATGLKRQTLGLEDDVRTTHKETLIENFYDGHIEALEGGGGYEATEWEAKAVQKQFISDNDHYGQAGRDRGDGYLTNEHEAKATQKSFISDNDHYGVADGAHKKQKSYNDMENARITERREILEFERDPTAEGAKEFNCNVNMRIKKQDCREPRKQNNMDRVYQTVQKWSDQQITKNKMAVDVDTKIGYDRFDPDLLKAYRDNPYTQRLDSAA